MSLIQSPSFVSTFYLLDRLISSYLLLLYNFFILSLFLLFGSQMNGAHLNGKAQGSENAVPGCLGRMVNLFDMSSGVSANRLLTDKPHNDGFLPRSVSDSSRMSNIAGGDVEDKVMVSEIRKSSSSRKPNGTPMKMLIAQEMSKDLKVRQNSSNVVAKLMGLDALPKQQPDLGTQKTHTKLYTRKCHSEIPIGYWQEEGSFLDKKVDREINSYQVHNEFKDIHEIVQQSQRKNCRREKSPQIGRPKSNENSTDKRLCLIRQKFMEAKRLATDEKLRQTKEFEDALDVLSSNGDLFLKVLQEPSSMFSQHLYEGQIDKSITQAPETKRITVLRPSKMMANDDCIAPARRDEKQVKKHFQVNQINLWENHPNGFSPTISTWKGNDSPTQTTRIVVLKPSSAKINGAPKSENFFAEPQGDAQEAREVAKEITQQMRENLAIHRKDETLISSVFSNGYIGDESSFEKSRNEFEDGNLGDSEVMSPTSRYSWEYVNRFESPYSISSFDRASCSPESSVCREAKKRLSERWTMMANGSNYQEERQFHRSSSTLGEMLALSEIKKPEICEEDSDIKDEDRVSTSFLNRSVGARESEEDSPRNLLRSKFVPISSTAYGERLNEVSNSVVCKLDILENLVKAKAPKSSFTGKVTSLFFSRSKKSRKDKSATSLANNESQSVSADKSGSLAPPERTSNDHSEVVLSPSEFCGRTDCMAINDKRTDHGIHQGALSMARPSTPVSQGGDEDQPSPISILEQSFEEDEGLTLGCSLSPDPHSRNRFNLIDKSPPIGSISRTMSCDESCARTVTSYPLSSSSVSPKAENDEGEWFYLVQSLLTMAGLNNEFNIGSNLALWHTLDSPLDPLLREKYIDLLANEPLHEANRRRLQSSRKLVFDSVNAALTEITDFRTTSSVWSGSYGETHRRSLESGFTSLTEKVWARMKEWFSGEDSGDSNNLVEGWVVKEVAGIGWANQSDLEIDEIWMEIEGKLLRELVEESLVELTGRD